MSPQTILKENRSFTLRVPLSPQVTSDDLRWPCQALLSRSQLTITISSNLSFILPVQERVAFKTAALNKSQRANNKPWKKEEKRDIWREKERRGWTGNKNPAQSAVQTASLTRRASLQAVAATTNRRRVYMDIKLSDVQWHYRQINMLLPSILCLCSCSTPSNGSIMRCCWMLIYGDNSQI